MGLKNQDMADFKVTLGIYLLWHGNHFVSKEIKKRVFVEYITVTFIKMRVSQTLRSIRASLVKFVHLKIITFNRKSL